MVEKVCLDSDIIIEISKDNKELKNGIENLEAEYSTTSINIFEVLCGEREGDNLRELLDDFSKLNFDEKSAKIASKIFKELKNKGKIIDARDIFIGSVCISNNSPLWTYNKKHFERLKDFGLKLI